MFRLLSLVALSLVGLPATATELELLSFAPADPHDMAAAASRPVAVTPDGRFVMIESVAPNLVAGATDTNGCLDLILVDRQTGTRRLVSHEPGQPNVARPHGASAGAFPRGLLSADGQVALFQNANDVLCSFPGINGWIVADHGTGTFADLADLISLPGIPPPVTAAVVPRALSADGQRILVSYGDHVVLVDLTTDTARLVSHAAGTPGTPANAPGTALELTPDGRFVLFTSTATDLVAGFVDGNPAAGELYRWDATIGTTILVSRVAGTTTTGAGAHPAHARLTPDGNTIAFDSAGTNLVPGQSDATGFDVFVFDATTGTTILVSHQAGLPLVAVGGSVHALSTDGRTTAFSSESLLPTGGLDGSPAFADLFLHDRDTNAATLVNRTGGLPLQSANGTAFFGALSGDGRYVLFSSSATDLVAGTTVHPAADTFRFDRTTGTVELVSHPPGQPTVEIGSGFLAADAAGGLVALVSSAPEAAAPLVDLNHTTDAFLADLAAGTLEALSTAAFPLLTTASRSSTSPVVSSDGRVIGYTSQSLEMVPGLAAVPPLAETAAVVHDRVARRAELVSHAAGAPQSPRHGEVAALSEDGRWVLLASGASDLVAGQNDSVASSPDLFLYDRETRQATLVSHHFSDPLLAVSGRPQALSADGRFVLWTGRPGGVVAGVPATEYFQLFLFDRTTGINQMVSRGTGSPLEPANRGAGGSGEFRARLSDDGRRVLFVSASSNLVAGDGNGRMDVFLFEVMTGTVRLVSHLPGQPGTVQPGFSDTPLLDASGRFAAFRYQPPDFSFVDLYLWDAVAGDTALVLRVPDPAGFNAQAHLVDLSPGGRDLLFFTNGSGFAAGVTDTPNSFDAFVFDREAGSFRLASFLPGQPSAAGQTLAVPQAFAGQGKVLFTTYDAAFLPPGTTAADEELVLVDLATGNRELLSHRRNDRTAGAGLGIEYFSLATSRHGDTIVFASESRQLFGDDFDFGESSIPLIVPGGSDVFLYRPDSLFADGFESGNLAAWSAAEP